jgi:hypothetical protein
MGPESMMMVCGRLPGPVGVAKDRRPFLSLSLQPKENAQNGLSTTNEFGLVLMMDFYKRGGRLCGQDLASLGKIREDR